MTTPPEITPPRRLARRPTDKHGRLIPWFVADVDGEPDHRIARADAVTDAVRLNLCWLCGEPLGAYKAFVIGPMCTINRLSAEPPSHKDCAEYAARACPFLTHPTMRRRPDLPEDTVAPDGEMDPRNPGICIVWTTTKYTQRPGQLLFDVGDPTEVSWWREGHIAEYAEGLQALLAGKAVLQAAAEKDRNPRRALEILEAQYAEAIHYIPGNFGWS
jgi:hypothetical protein